jgi:predicted MFS family arabinose efflux permease
LERLRNLSAVRLDLARVGRDTCHDVQIEPSGHGRGDAAVPLIAILSIACFAGAISIRLVDPIIPDIARDMNVAPALVALLATAFAFPYALSQPLLGPMGDTFGKARVIKFGLAALMVCLTAVALAPSMDWMFVARAFAGIAGGAIIPVALAMVGDRVPYERRQVALSQLLSAMLIAQFVSLIGSGLIASYAGWRTALGMGALVAAIALVVSLFALKPRANVQREPLNVASLKASYADVFQNPLAVVCYAAVFVEGVVIFGLIPYVSVLLEARGAGSLTEAGIVIAGMGIGGLIFTGGVKRLLTRFGSMTNLIRLGGVIVAFGFCGVALQGSWPVEFVSFIFVGFGFYAVHNSLQTQATELAPEHRGAAVALHAFFFFLGHAAGPPIYALLFKLIGPSATILVMGAAAAVGAMVLAWAFLARGPTVERPA